MRKILITNDDGIAAPGIQRLAETAKRFGEVWVVAPDGQRSAASHSITLHDTIDAHPYDFPVPGVRAWSLTGTPGDCVRVGCRTLMPRKPDVVLSGLNRGYNVASDIQYSATVGAALEGAFQGCLSIALSEDASDCHETADAYLEQILAVLLKEKLSEGEIFNVNFPCCPLAECRGILYKRTVSHAIPYDDHYPVVRELPEGGLRFRVEGILSEEAEDGSDYRAVLDRYISVGVVRNIMS